MTAARRRACTARHRAPRPAAVVIDQMEAAMAEAGELVQALQQGYLRRADIIEIGQLLAGGAAAGRRSQPPSPRAPAGPAASGPTIFKSVGIAAQDWAACELVVRRAREAGAIPAEARRRRHSPGFPDDERR